MINLPIDITLQVLHERNFCAYSVVKSFHKSQRRLVKDGKPVRVQSKEEERKADTRQRRRVKTLADIVQERAMEIVAEWRKNDCHQDRSDDIKDSETFCDEQTCRNTAINSLNGAKGISAKKREEAIRKAMKEVREKEEFALEGMLMQQATEQALGEFLCGKLSDRLDSL